MRHNKIIIFTACWAMLALTLAPSPTPGARAYQPVNQLAAQPGDAGPALPAPEGENAPDRQAASESAGARDSGVRLFGTVEFRRPLESLPGWLDVLKRNKADPIFLPEKQFNKSVSWRKMKESVSGRQPLEQLRQVNAFWNGWPYREDMANWGKPDYWATPAQFLKKSGDCEDYAIVKYFTLKELGFPAEKMRIVVLRDTIRNLAHAVLVVYMDDDALVLDNLSNVTLSHRRLGNYVPQYSVNEFGRWAHIRPKSSRKRK